MTGFAHTPGPWRIGANGDILAPDGSTVADTGSSTQADAVLMAESPAMVALLLRVVEHFAHTDAPLGADARAILERLERAPDEDEDRDDPRERGDDDGREYADPRDYRAGRE